MNESEMLRVVRQMVRQEIAHQTMGTIISTESNARATAQRFSDDAPMANMRLIHPYGFASRPKPGMDCVVSPVGGNVTHLNVTGQFDSSRPALAEGEAVLYGADGQVIFMKNGGTIHQGTEAASEPVVLGNVLVAMLTALLNEFINTQPIAYDVFGLPVQLNPQVILDFIQQRLVYLETSSSNIIGQKNFVERGA